MRGDESASRTARIPSSGDLRNAHYFDAASHVPPAGIGTTRTCSVTVYSVFNKHPQYESSRSFVFLYNLHAISIGIGNKSTSASHENGFVRLDINKTSAVLVLSQIGKDVVIREFVFLQWSGRVVFILIVNDRRIMESRNYWEENGHAVKYEK